MFARLIPPDEVAAIVVEPVLGEVQAPTEGLVRDRREPRDWNGIGAGAHQVRKPRDGPEPGKTWAIKTRRS